MRAVDIIVGKREGRALDRAEIDYFVRGVTDGSLRDYQASALLMAILLRGMTPDETTWLTDSMVDSGVRVALDDIPGIGPRSRTALLKALGCDTLILTNAAGSLRAEVGPGEIMLITDHIAFSGPNPLIGEPSEARFVGLTEAYDAKLRAAFLAAAKVEGVALATGVYMWFSGPAFETPAEIRMARIVGADAVGMSTVPEVILARFFGLRVAAVSTITNLAAGMTGAELSHEETKALAPVGAAKLERVIRRYLGERAGGRA